MPRSSQCHGRRSRSRIGRLGECRPAIDTRPLAGEAKAARYPACWRSVYRPLTLTGRCGRACGTRRGGTSAWAMLRPWMGPDMAGSHPPRGALVGRCRSLRAAGGDVFSSTETGAPGPATSGRARRPKRGADCALNSLVAGVAEFLPCSFSKPATWGCRVRLQSQDAGPSRVHGGDTNLD